MRSLLVAGLALLLAGCSVISTSDVLLPESTAANPPGLNLSPVQFCTDKGALNPRLSSKEVADRLRAVEQRLSQDFGVAQNVVKLITGALQAAVDRKPAPETSVSSNELRDFATKLHQKVLAMAAHAQRSGADLDEKIREFNAILITYVNAYVQGNYVDRFGNVLDAPTLSMTIGDGEIAGILTVLLDSIGDYALASPVWKNAAGVYFPASFIGGSTDKSKALKPTGAISELPAAARSGPKKTIIEVKDLEEDGACGIDSKKAQAIEFLSQTAGLRAAAASGMIGGSFGGFGVSLGVFGKLSVGDNKTLQTIIKTAFYKVAERVAYEAAYRTLSDVQFDKNLSFADLIQQYIADELKKHGTKI